MRKILKTFPPNSMISFIYRPLSETLWLSMPGNDSNFRWRSQFLLTTLKIISAITIFTFCFLPTLLCSFDVLSIFPKFRNLIILWHYNLNHCWFQYGFSAICRLFTGIPVSFIDSYVLETWLMKEITPVLLMCSHTMSHIHGCRCSEQPFTQFLHFN